MTTQPESDPLGFDDVEGAVLTERPTKAPTAAPPEATPFLNREYGVIGRTASTRFEPNTSSKFLFWVADKTKAGGKGVVAKGDLEIGNIVAAWADDDKDITFGSVVEMRSYSDVESFISDYLSHNFGDAAIEVPTDVSEVVVVTCNVMRNLSGRTKPLGRSQVFFPSALGIEFAYGMRDEKGEPLFTGAPIPIGVFENGDGTIAPVSIDEHFVIGPEGAHLNVSGISGLASKTSATQFVLKSVLTHTKKRVAIVMFNVKSRDLLYVDRPNTRLAEEPWSQEVYKALEIPADPFKAAYFFAPADPKDPKATQGLRTLKTRAFQWDLQQVKDDIPSLFDSMDWDDKLEGVWHSIRDAIDQEPITTYAQMLGWVKRKISDADKAQHSWVLGNHVATWRKMLSHLQRFPKSFSGLIATAGPGTDIPWNWLKPGRVYVIDIQMLNDRGKKLVFGRAIREISELMERESKVLDAVIVYVDELNKFAPSGSVKSPLKNRLVDITARGRSIGVVLFGAEQFSSSVEREIVENSSTFLFGRTESNELRTPTYAGFSDEVKTKLTMLPQGQLLAKFAKFPQPIFLKFPFPPCLPGDQFRLGEHDRQAVNDHSTDSTESEGGEPR